MSEPAGDGLLHHPDVTGAPHASVGAVLKALRESKGITLSDASARVKYSVSQLKHLEACAWDTLPGGVPLRGLVRNYARFLGADVDATLRLLDEAVGPTQPHPTVTAVSERRLLQPADLSARGEPAHRTWAWLLIILILFFAVGFYAINRGWVPDEWLVFDWLRAMRS